MGKLIKVYLKHWYIPVLISVLTVVIGIFLSYTSINTLLFGISLPAIAILASGIIGIKRLFRKSYLRAILQIGLSGIIAMVWLVCAFMLFNRYDFYASFLSVPEGLEIREPAGNQFEKIISISQQDSMAQAKEPMSTDFSLLNSSQPGLYEIEIWIEKLDSGMVYLKAFEITKNDPLSVPRLQKSSAIAVKNSSDSIKKYSSSKHFTIYEGDWGDYYAARFELWYQAKDSNQSILLKERNYKIQGWMR